jgi:hypothetical protein
MRELILQNALLKQQLMKTFARLIIPIVLFASVVKVHGQSIAPGIEAAITTSKIRISDIQQIESEIKGNGILGFEAGVFLRGSIGPIYIKPKALLDYQGGSLQFNMNNEEQNVSFHIGRVLIPVLVGFKFLPVLGIEAGPVYNHILYATKDVNGNRLEMKKDGIGYRIGLNASLSKLNLTISYQGIKNSGSFASAASYQTPNQMVFGVGFEF